MKTSVNFLLLFCFLLFVMPACKKDCGSNTLSISKIEPSSNPPGYEIRLVGMGFSDNTVVRFDNSESADTRLVDGTTLIATIPTGVLGPVEISVSDGDCVGRNDSFEVFADFPGTIPFSPSNIIIAPPATSYPSNFQNGWVNIHDKDHSIFLENVEDPNGILGENSSEFHNTNGFLNSNKVTGYIRFNESAQTSDVRIEIDRSQQTGGELEIYSGEFIDPASVESDYAFILLLTSQKDGRQIVLQYGN